MTLSRDDVVKLRKAADLGLLNDLRGATFSMTGRLSMTRNDMRALIRACHGRIEDHPTYGTRYLIVGDTAQHGVTVKITEARRKGVETITEEDLVRMITP